MAETANRSRGSGRRVRGTFAPRSTMRVPQPDIIEHFGNADAVPQLPERCLSRKAGIVRYCPWNPQRIPAALCLTSCLCLRNIRHFLCFQIHLRAIPHNSRLTAQAPLRQLRHGICVAKMLDKTSSIICAFGLASAAPRSPYQHLELCGIALEKL